MAAMLRNGDQFGWTHSDALQLWNTRVRWLVMSLQFAICPNHVSNGVVTGALIVGYDWGGAEGFPEHWSAVVVKIIVEVDG